MQPEIKSFEVNLEGVGEQHKISYAEWGTGNKKLLVCIHGLTRNGRDFDMVAGALAGDYHVIAPDMPGRGKSGWLKNFYLYNNDYYLEVTRALISSLGYTECDWLGTSMGGLMGMIGGAKYPKLIGRMVLNDIGPYIDAGGMRRIATYIKDEVIFPSLQIAQQRMREIYEPFKIPNEEIWQHMFDYGLRPAENGGYTFAHDPQLGAAFKTPDGGLVPIGEFDLWRVWEAVKCPVLVLRGELSDILSREVALKMTARAGTELVEFKGYGHVPPLLNDEQVGVVRKFLLNL